MNARESDAPTITAAAESTASGSHAARRDRASREASLVRARETPVKYTLPADSSSHIATAARSRA